MIAHTDLTAHDGSALKVPIQSQKPSLDKPEGALVWLQRRLTQGCWSVGWKHTRVLKISRKLTKCKISDYLISRNHTRRMLGGEMEPTGTHTPTTCWSIRGHLSSFLMSYQKKASLSLRGSSGEPLDRAHVGPSCLESQTCFSPAHLSVWTAVTLATDSQLQAVLQLNAVLPSTHCKHSHSTKHAEPAGFNSICLRETPCKWTIFSPFRKIMSVSTLHDAHSLLGSNTRAPYYIIIIYQLCSQN